ncbi:ParB N-terminal domain-containing protein [Streptomyces sp. NPDC049555]|uniref:ParB/RepB/Spo0J family partition protein n=1 Tax=Streptomyces sp. NPDC049555 TaxID=3154930 RepID=UPI003437DA14
MSSSARIPASLADLAVPLADLVAYHRNPRTGDVAAISESLATHGQYRPIVVNRGTLTGRPNEILAGNHTAKAARELGWDEIAVTWLDVDDEAAAKIVIVDNRSSDLAGYDHVLLADILDELPDLDGTGYDQDALDELLDRVQLPSALPTETQDSEGAKPEADYLQWGYMQWGVTRVQVTSEEIDRLNAAHKAYVEVHGTDGGFGHFVLDGSARTVAAGA